MSAANVICTDRSTTFPRLHTVGLMALATASFCLAFTLIGPGSSFGGYIRSTVEQISSVLA